MAKKNKKLRPKAQKLADSLNAKESKAIPRPPGKFVYKLRGGIVFTIDLSNTVRVPFVEKNLEAVLELCKGPENPSIN